MEELISKKAIELLGLLSVKKIIPSAQKNKPEIPIIGVNEIANLGRVKHVIRYQTDSYGRKISIKKCIGNYNYSFDIANYKKVVELGDLFFEMDFIKDIGDSEFIEDTIFEWAVKMHLGDIIRVSLIQYITVRLKQELKYFTYYFRVESLGIDKEFGLANIAVASLPKSFFEREYDLLENPSFDKKSFIDGHKRFLNCVITSVTVFGTQKSSLSKAKKEIQLSLNAIKSFLSEDSLNISIQMFNVEYMDNSIDSTIYLYKPEIDKSVINTVLEKNNGVQPVVLTQKMIESFIDKGLNNIINFLLTKRKTELYFHIEKSLNLLGEILSTRNLHLRSVKLVTFFEVSIVPKNSGSSKGEKIMKEKILPKLGFQNYDNLITPLRTIYKVRDQYLHNGYEPRIDLNDLHIMQQVALRFLTKLTVLEESMKTVEEVLSYFEIKY